MYNPPAFKETRLDVVHDFMEERAFGLLISGSESELVATHVPFILDRTRGPFGTLQAHVARGNAHHRALSIASEVLVVFSGPDAYITPNWYASKLRDGKVVPTWNYAAVHIYGNVSVIDDAKFLREHVGALTRRHERERPTEWQVSDAPADYVDKQLAAIVGVEIAITRFDAKWKASQNRPAEDIQGVIAGLSASPNERDREMGAIVRERAPNAAKQV